jgi:Holliday junction DNA helicase RuvA
MIGSLRGHVIDRHDTEVLVEVAGVGHRVACTPTTALELAAEPGEVFVWVHHQVREDAQTLYGFTERGERQVFETLIGTHGVGPSLALAIMSVHSPRALSLAIATDDVAALCLVPGVGRKTATRLLVELKSRLDLGDVDLTELSTTSGSGGPVVASAHADVREALGGLGYGPDEIASVVRDLPPDGDSADLLRRALSVLAVR